MLSPSLEKATLPPSFEHLLQQQQQQQHHQQINSSGAQQLHQQYQQQNLNNAKLNWNSIGFGSFNLLNPHNNQNSITNQTNSGSTFGRLFLSTADTHRASSNCSTSSSTRSDCSGGASPEPPLQKSLESPPAHASSMPRARTGSLAINSIHSPAADARLLHPLAMHYAAAAQLHQVTTNGRHLLHPLSGTTAISPGSIAQNLESNHTALPLLFASTNTNGLSAARLTTTVTGPRLDYDGCSDDELNVDSNGIDDPMDSNMALNLTGRARSCSPTSTGSPPGSRPPSVGHSVSNSIQIDRNTSSNSIGNSLSNSNGPIPASFSLLTSSTILGQSAFLSSSVFPPPTSPSININSTSSDSNSGNSSCGGPTLHSKPTCASLQRAHSAPYKPHKWLRPVNNSSNTSQTSPSTTTTDPTSASSPLSLSSLSPLSTLAPLSPLPTPPTPSTQFSCTSNSDNTSTANGSTICSPLLHQHQQQLLPNLSSGPATPLPPPPPPQLELRLTRQPAKFHRARYMTEGSRGPIRDKSGKSFPAIRLIGFDEHPVPVYCYLSDDRQIAQPHLFYQASKLSSRCVTSCTELRLGGTNALQFELQPSQNMELTIDCLGIVKQRLFEIQQNAAAANNGTNAGSGNLGSNTSNNTTNGLSNGSNNAPLDRGAKSPCCRIVFECYLPKYNHILQTYSDTIHCKQVMRAPEVHRMSSNEASARGGNELFVIGKNFGKDARLLLRLEGGQWQAHAWPEKELLHQTHLVCRLPPFDTSLMRTRGECVGGQWRAQVELYVLCDGKRSAKQLFTYFE